MSLIHKYESNKTVLSNFSYLTVLQFFTLLFPFVTYPYLLKVLGFDIYGKVIYAQAIATNIAIIINYGFNISGTNNIAINREDKSKLSEIVSSIYILKGILWLICLLLYTTIIFFVPFFQEDSWLYFIAFFITFNDLLFPIWYFQGIEKMKYITFINVGIRAVFAIFIFILVTKKTDYYIICLLNALGAFIGGVIALYVVITKEKVRLKCQSFAILKYHLEASFPVFISSLSVQIYVNISKLLVGSFLGMTEIAIYDMGEKIASLVKIPISMISQATFPKISREKNIAYINKVMWITAGLVFVLYIIIFIAVDYTVLFLSGEYNSEASNVVRILAFSAILVVFTYFLGVNRLVVFGYRKVYMINAIFSCLLLIVSNIVLGWYGVLNVYSISFLYISIEIFILLITLYYNNKYNLLFYSRI